MDITKDRYFIISQKMLSLAGFCHTQTYKERLLRYYVIGVILPYCLLCQMCQMASLDFDMWSFTTMLQLFIPNTCFVVLYYTYIVHYVKLKNMLIRVTQDLHRLSDDIELKIMKKYLQENKLFSLFCGCTKETTSYIASLVYFTSFTLPTILYGSAEDTNMYRFPVSTCFDYFFNREKYYYYIALLQVIMLIFVITVAITLYTLFFSIIQHACALLSIIKKKIQQPFIDKQYTNKTNYVFTTQADLSHWIIDIIRSLGRIAEYITWMNALSNKCYLVQIVLVCLLIMVNFVCLLQMPDLLGSKANKVELFMLTLLLCLAIFVIYMNCYIGQRLIDYSMDVCEELCLIPIHDISLKTQKLLLITLMLNTKPYEISIGKMFVASHQFFSNLLRTSLSFAMVLRSVQKI